MGVAFLRPHCLLSFVLATLCPMLFFLSARLSTSFCTPLNLCLHPYTHLPTLLRCPPPPPRYNKDMMEDKRAVQKLRREVERAKRTLSTQHQARVEIEALFDGIDFSEPLTRARFEELNIDLFRKTLDPVKNVRGVSLPA